MRWAGFAWSWQAAPLITTYHQFIWQGGKLCDEAGGLTLPMFEVVIRSQVRVFSFHYPLWVPCLCTKVLSLHFLEFVICMCFCASKFVHVSALRFPKSSVWQIHMLTNTHQTDKICWCHINCHAQQHRRRKVSAWQRDVPWPSFWFRLSSLSKGVSRIPWPLEHAQILRWASHHVPVCHSATTILLF